MRLTLTVLIATTALAGAAQADASGTRLWDILPRCPRRFRP